MWVGCEQWFYVFAAGSTAEFKECWVLDGCHSPCAKLSQGGGERSHTLAWAWLGVKVWHSGWDNSGTGRASASKPSEALSKAGRIKWIQEGGRHGKGHQEDLERGKQTKRQASGGRNKKAEAAAQTEGESGRTMVGWVGSEPCSVFHFLTS